MPALLEALGVWLRSAIVGMVARVLGSVGMGVVTYVGVTSVINQLVQTLHSQLGGIPSDGLHLLGLAGFDVFLSLVISAKTGVITWLLVAGGFKRLSFLNQGQ